MVQWKGLAHYARRFVYGAVSAPEIARGEFGSDTPTDSKNYDAMDPNYRWFRLDEMVRRCTVINAGFVALAAGFQTVLEPVKPITDENEKAAFLANFQYVKDFVDAVNKQVNLDHALFVAAVKCSIFGKAGFEKVLDSDGAPAWLLSLQSPKLKPLQNKKTWELVGFKYQGKDTPYAKETVLYFVNTDLENDYLGFSDVEPIRNKCELKQWVWEEGLKRAVERSSKPSLYAEADTSGMKVDKAQEFLQTTFDAVNSGDNVVANRKVTITAIALKPDIPGVLASIDKADEAILREYGTPRFLVNKTPENRATAFVEFEGYISGVIEVKQRYFKRALETGMWYDMLVLLALKANNYDGDVPVRVKHEWKKIRASDINDAATAVTNLYGNGMGILAEFPEFAFDMMGWDKSKLIEWQKKQQEMAPQSQPKSDESLPGVEKVEPTVKDE